MPERDRSLHSDDAVPRPGLHSSEELPAQDEVVSRRAVRQWIRFLPMQPHPARSRRFSYGDLLEGSVGVVALLLMLAIGTTVWLAVPLAVVTYIAVALLRPKRNGRDQIGESNAAGNLGPEATARDRGHVEVPNEALTGADVVAARFRLTRREQEVLPLLAQRLTDREIAERLSISHRTAMNHTANILGKLGLESRREVAIFVARHAGLSVSVPPHVPE